MLEVKAADKERYDIFSFMMSIIRSNINNFDTTKKDAATKLDYITKPYRGASSKSFVQQSALGIHLVIDLKTPDYTPPVATLDLTQAVEKLDQANEKFKAIYVTQFDETKKRKTMDNMVTIRKKVDEAYYQLTDAINASYTYNTNVVKEMLFGEIIDKINAIVEMINQMQHLSGKRKGEDEEKKEEGLQEK